MLGLARLAQSHRNNGIATGWQATVVSLAPYSFLRFKETSGSVAADSSGNNRAGAYVNSPILMGESLVPSDPAGRSITSGLGPRGATILGHAGQTDFTMIFCAKVGDASFGGIPALVNWNGNDAFYWMGQNGRPKLGSTEVIDARSILLTDGKPHIHVIRTKAGKSTLATDVSGGYAAESLYTSAATISVGYNTGTNSGLVGQFGEPAVWDKYLSDDDVLKAILAWRGDEVNPLSVSARYWRVYCTATQKGDGYLNMASIAFRAVREGYCHGAQPEIVTDQSSFVPGKDAHSCLKGDGLGNWQTEYQTTPWWASADFGRPVQVAEVAMKGINVAGRQPKDFIIQSSPNGIDWVDRATFSGITGWNTVTERSFQVPAAKTYDMIVMEDAPLAWYKGDEAQGATVMADSSGNGYDGTYTASASLVLGNPALRSRGKGSMSMKAVGYAATANNAALNVWGTAQWGMEFVALYQGGGSVGQKIFGYNGTIGGFGSFSTQWRGNALQATGSGASISSPNNTLNQIKHYFLERNGSVMTLYENGLPVATGPGGGGGSGDLFLMGSSAYPSSYGFIGYASDFAIYDKAIGPDRIFKHAEAANPGVPDTVFHPMDLFKNGEKGVWFDFSDLSTMFQDVAGTIPVTTVGQSVALVKDKSGNLQHVTQNTSGNRPTLVQDTDNVYGLRFTSASKQWLERAADVTLAPRTNSMMVGIAFKPVSGVGATMYSRAVAASGSNRYQGSTGPNTNLGFDSGIYQWPTTNNDAVAAGNTTVKAVGISTADRIAGVNTAKYLPKGGAVTSGTQSLNVSSSDLASNYKFRIAGYGNAADTDLSGAAFDGIIYGLVIRFGVVDYFTTKNVEIWLQETYNI